LPVDLYVGGAEHAVLHLLYARFWHKFLYDIGAVPTKEPFQKLYNQGMIIGEDNAKMSKSLGNVINPDQVIESHGADTLRHYEMFMGRLYADGTSSTTGLDGSSRLVERAWPLGVDTNDTLSTKVTDDRKELEKTYHETVKKVPHHFKTLHANTGISQLMRFV